MIFNRIGQISQGIFDVPDEIIATGGEAPQADDRLAFSMIVGHREDLPEGHESMRGALDQLIGSLTRVRVEDLHTGVGRIAGLRSFRRRPIEENGDRGSDSVLVQGEPADEFIASGCGIPGVTRRQLQPFVQEAVAVDQDAH